MRVPGQEQAEFERVFAEVMKRLQTLRGREEVRWHELLQFALTYAIWRRPVGERQRLQEIAVESHPQHERQVRVMAETIAEAYIREGRAEGRTEGRVEEARTSIRVILESRFGVLSETLVRDIAAISDLTRLREAIRRAALTQTLEEFRP